jgi:hypothetical protein
MQNYDIVVKFYQKAHERRYRRVIKDILKQEEIERIHLEDQ